jgi:signal transduction histidine kinase
MKFLTKINRNFLIFFSLILAVVTISGYFILHIIIVRGARENLLTREYFIEKQILSTGGIPNLHPLVEVKKTTDSIMIKPTFSEVTIWNELENENEVFIEFSDKIRVDNSFYILKLRISAFENEDLVLILAVILFTLLSVAFIISFLITRKMNKTVWADFENNLQEIERFSLSMSKDMSLLRSDTEEFERLNRVLIDLTEKIKSDYRILKEFTENTSHEIQTPISVALLNLEEILQKDVDEETFRKTAASISAIKRLSSLNQSLVLLSKIENRQYADDKAVSLSEIAMRKKEEFAILFESRSLDITIEVEDDLIINIDARLAEIMLNNLFSNAVNHNIKGGRISIFIGVGSFRICNTGPENVLTDETVFSRFTRGDQKTFGLGLAIVRKICESCNLDIHYNKGDQHCFEIKPKS